MGVNLVCSLKALSKQIYTRIAMVISLGQEHGLNSDRQLPLAGGVRHFQTSRKLQTWFRFIVSIAGIVHGCINMTWLMWRVRVWVDVAELAVPD